MCATVRNGRPKIGASSKKKGVDEEDGSQALKATISLRQSDWKK